MVYFIVGPNGVGKTFFANKFSNDTNIKTFDTGPILRNIYKSRNLNIPFSKWIQIGENEYGDNFAIGLICDLGGLDGDRDFIKACGVLALYQQE